MLIVHAGIDPQIEIDRRLIGEVPGHVAADVIGRVGQAIWKTGICGEQQEMRTPDIAGRKDERSRTVLDVVVRSVEMDVAFVTEQDVQTTLRDLEAEIGLPRNDDALLDRIFNKELKKKSKNKA